jgi:hypothetical protein
VPICGSFQLRPQLEWSTDCRFAQTDISTIESIHLFAVLTDWRAQLVDFQNRFRLSIDHDRHSVSITIHRHLRNDFWNAKQIGDWHWHVLRLATTIECVVVSDKEVWSQQCDSDVYRETGVSVSPPGFVIQQSTSQVVEFDDNEYCINWTLRSNAIRSRPPTIGRWPSPSWFVRTVMIDKLRGGWQFWMTQLTPLCWCWCCGLCQIWHDKRYVQGWSHESQLSLTADHSPCTGCAFRLIFISSTWPLDFLIDQSIDLWFELHRFLWNDFTLQESNKEQMNEPCSWLSEETKRDTRCERLNSTISDFPVQFYGFDQRTQAGLRVLCFVASMNGKYWVVDSRLPTDSSNCCFVLWRCSDYHIRYHSVAVRWKNPALVLAEPVQPSAPSISIIEWLYGSALTISKQDKSSQGTREITSVSRLRLNKCSWKVRIVRTPAFRYLFEDLHNAESAQHLILRTTWVQWGLWSDPQLWGECETQGYRLAWRAPTFWYSRFGFKAFPLQTVFWQGHPVLRSPPSRQCIWQWFREFLLVPSLWVGQCELTDLFRPL